MYHVYVLPLLPLMLCIGGTTITTGDNQAGQFSAHHALD
jgi:hypothetical protein